MTVIQPNSVSGINSITVQNGNSLSVHKSDGSLIRTITGTTGITTFRTISVGSATTDFAQGSGINIGLGASISNGSGNTLTFGTGGDDRATIDSSGRLLVGTTTEGEASADDLTIANSGDCGITIRSGSSDKGKIFFSDATSGAGEYDGYIQYQHNDGALRFGTGGSERSRLDASGRLVVGATSSNNVGGFGGAAFQVEGLTAGTSALSLIRHSANTVGSTILMGKSRGTSDGATTVVQSGDNVARIIAYGADGTDTESSLGAIQFDVDGTPGSNDMPGRIVFSTTPDGAATYTEKLRITSAGNVTQTIGADAIGFNQTAAGNHYVKNVVNANRSGAGAGILAFHGQWNSKDVASIKFRTGADTTNKDDGHICFETSSANNITERLRINSDGKVLIGHTASESLFYTGSIQVQGTNSSTSGITVKSNQNDSGGPAIVLGKSRSGSVGGNTVVQDGDEFGCIYFNGADGTDTVSQGAFIRGSCDGTPGSNDMPGRLVFGTTADGAATATERLRIDKAGLISMPLNGVLSIGNQAGRNIDWVHSLQVEGTSAANSSISITRNSNDINPPYLTFCKSRGTSVDGETAVQENDLIGNIQFKAADGNSGESTAAQITCEIDAAVGNSDTAGRLFFKTSADGSGSPVSRMEINKDGYVYIKTGDLDVQSGTVSDSKGNVRKVYKNEQANAYTLVAADAGKCIGAQNTVTIPASVFGNGDMVSIVNYTGGNITLTQGSGLTLYNTGDGSTGNRTLATRGMATVWFPAGTTSYISGSGLS